MEHTQKLTVVILNWKRPGNVMKILDAYETYSCISEIIVRNNYEGYHFTYIGTKTKVINSMDCGLDSRFTTALLAENDAVLYNDDDILLPEVTCKGLLDEWVKDPEIIHGIFGRDPRQDGSYAIYNDFKDMECDIVLSSLCVANRNYAEEFFVKRSTPEMQEIKKLATRMNIHPDNGEDIIFAYTVKSITKRKNKTHNFSVSFLPSPFAISSNNGHYLFRSILLRVILKNDIFS